METETAQHHRTIREFRVNGDDTRVAYDAAETARWERHAHAQWCSDPQCTAPRLTIIAPDDVQREND